MSYKLEIGCFNIEEYFNRYFDNVLNETEKRRFKEHIESCENCKDRFEEFQNFNSLIKSVNKNYKLSNIINNSEKAENRKSALFNKIAKIEKEKQSSKKQGRIIKLNFAKTFQEYKKVAVYLIFVLIPILVAIFLSISLMNDNIDNYFDKLGKRYEDKKSTNNIKAKEYAMRKMHTAINDMKNEKVTKEYLEKKYRSNKK